MTKNLGWKNPRLTGRKDQKTPPSWKQLFTDSVILYRMISYIDRITWHWGGGRWECKPVAHITGREVAVRLLE